MVPPSDAQVVQSYDNPHVLTAWCQAKKPSVSKTRRSDRKNKDQNNILIKPGDIRNLVSTWSSIKNRLARHNIMLHYNDDFYYSIPLRLMSMSISIYAVNTKMLLVLN